MAYERIRKARRGQFVVVAAVIIGILVMGTSLVISQLGSTRKSLGYKPVKETVLTIASDLDRALLHALSSASQTRYSSGSQDAAREEGYGFISTWTRALLTAYSNLGLEMKLQKYTPTEPGPVDVDFDFNWVSNPGMSHAYTEFDMNLTTIGFTGWESNREHTILLAMDTDAVIVQEKPAPGTTTLNFTLTQNGAPISNLAAEDLRLLIYLTGQGDHQSWLGIDNRSLTLNYKGAGTYTLTVPRRLSEQGRGINLTARTPDDRVLVQAYWLDVQGSSQNFTFQGAEGPGDNGTIQVGDLTFSSNQTVTLTEGNYSLSINPPEGYVFANWTTTGNITVGNPYSPETILTVNGTGTITVFYEPATPAAVNGDSEQLGGGNPKPGQLNLNNPQGGSLASGAQVTYQMGENESDYVVTYTPQPGTYFLYWEAEGNVTVASPFSPSTNITVGEEGGNVTAIYQPPYTLSLSSREENWQSTDLGDLTLRNKNNQNTVAGPAPEILYTNVPPNGQTYTAVFAPDPNYIFLYWTTIGNVTVQNPTNPTSKVDVSSGGGALIAVYRHVADVRLSSYDWEGLSVNQGRITFGGDGYPLMGSAVTLNDIPAGTYAIGFTRQFENQTFLWWETTSNVIRIGNSSSASTYVVVDGDCNITAVYATGVITLAEPPDSPWDVLYVDEDYAINPIYLWSMEPGKLAPSFSTGNDKLAAVLFSPPSPRLRIAELVNVSVIVRPNPPNSVKSVYVELGYHYEDHYHYIGSGTTDVNEDGIYKIPVDSTNGEYQEGEPLIIPRGSTIQLIVELTFYHEYSGWGTFFLYYGYIRPSCVELGGKDLP